MKMFIYFENKYMLISTKVNLLRKHLSKVKVSFSLF